MLGASLCLLTIVGEAWPEVLWELSGSNVGYAEALQATELLDASEDGQRRIMTEVFWSGELVDFNAQVPIAADDKMSEDELRDARWEAWGTETQPAGAYVPTHSDAHASVAWMLGDGTGVRWFWALCGARTDVELLYEVALPALTNQADIFYGLCAWHREPGRSPRRLVGYEPPPDLWRMWALDEAVVIRPAGA